jgi:peptidoglycan/LPS O-acetylase OafA/YrhL
MVIAARFYIWENKEFYPTYERAFLFTRLDGILIGSMLAAIYKINAQLLRKYFTFFLLALTAVNYLFYLYKQNQSPDFPVWAIAGFTTFSLIFAIVVYEAVMKENRVVNYILTNPVLRFLGKYSYGFYIFHWPVFLLVKPYTDKFVAGFINPNGYLAMFLSSLFATLAGLLVSVASYHFFERYFLNLKKRFE